MWCRLSFKKSATQTDLQQSREEKSVLLTQLFFRELLATCLQSRSDWVASEWCQNMHNSAQRHTALTSPPQIGILADDVII